MIFFIAGTLQKNMFFVIPIPFRTYTKHFRRFLTSFWSSADQRWFSQPILKQRWSALKFIKSLKQRCSALICSGTSTRVSMKLNFCHVTSLILLLLEHSNVVRFSERNELYITSQAEMVLHPTANKTNKCKIINLRYYFSNSLICVKTRSCTLLFNTRNAVFITSHYVINCLISSSTCVDVRDDSDEISAESVLFSVENPIVQKLKISAENPLFWSRENQC